MRRVWLAAALAAAWLTAAAAADENLLKNPGFEATQGQGAKPTDWDSPSYWSGELSSVTDPVHGGRRAAKLVAKPKGATTFGRVMDGPAIPVILGLRYRFTLWARGTGTLKLGVVNYTAPKPPEPNYRYAWQEPGIALTDTWQQLSFEAAPLDDAVVTMLPVVEVDGTDAVAYLDDAGFATLHRVQGELKLTPSYLMVTPGTPVKLTVEVTAAAPLTDAKLTAISRVEAPPQTPAAPAAATRTAVPLTDGRGTFTCTAPDAPGLLRVDLLQSDLGRAATAYVDVVEPATAQAFAAAARAAKVSPPAHLLFLGDSLTDFYRGWNYVDQLGYWLSQAHGDGVTVKNAGVGGDYITRVWDRLNGDPKVWRLSVYDGLYQPKPNRVFIFLGHNDSKLSSGSGFKDATVSPEDYDRLFRQVIAKVQADTGARITLLSNTSSVYEITKANTDKLVAAGKPASLFGVPEVMERYNAIARKVAADLGCDWIDVYTPTKTNPNKPSLFVPDGVHLSLAGNHLVALEVLKAMAK